MYKIMIVTLPQLYSKMKRLCLTLHICFRVCNVICILFCLFQLIQFMIHLVGGKSGLSGAGLSKRKMPLMINDSSQVIPSKRPRYNDQLSIEEVQPQSYAVESVNNIITSTSSHFFTLFIYGFYRTVFFAC